ncbi:MAG: hypothetical protein WC376_03425 [Candidatus Nanoarchaeia archaeon]|jgi:glycerophosphoryl diester phosphodiesterase
MKIIESYLQGKKKDQELCEDCLIVSGRFCGVVDGGTDKTGIDWGNGKTGGKILSLIVKDAFESNNDLGVEKIKGLINNKFQELAKKNNVNINDRVNLPDAAAAIYDSKERKIYYIGDCKARFVYNTGKLSEQFIPDLRIDLINSRLRKTVIDVLYELGINPFRNGRDLGREFIVPLLKKQSLLANTDSEGEWFMGIPYEAARFNIINGVDDINFDEINVPKKVDEVVIASDGFVSVEKSLKLSMKKLNESIKEDPQRCKKYLSTKGVGKGQVLPDDISYVRISIKD